MLSKDILEDHERRKGKSIFQATARIENAESLLENCSNMSVIDEMEISLHQGMDALNHKSFTFQAFRGKLSNELISRNILSFARFSFNPN